MDTSQIVQLIQLLEKLGNEGVQAIQWVLANLAVIENLIHSGISLDQIVQIILKALGLA